MKVKKRNGNIVDFDKNKIVVAIMKAMKFCGNVSKNVANLIANTIEKSHINDDIISISMIESEVFSLLVDNDKKAVARAYEGYRAIREFQRNASSDIETQINELLEGASDYWNNENSNKNEKLVTTQRDYMAGIVSTNITRKYLLTPDIIQAHDAGILHFHKLIVA